MEMNDEAAERLGASLEALNARIARLAIGLGISLDDRACMDKLMHQSATPPVAYERRVARQSTYPAGSVARRTAHQREELRGLLVIRYQMETSSVTDNGLDITRKIVLEAQEHLVQQGFKPGADGSGLDEFLKAQ